MSDFSEFDMTCMRRALELARTAKTQQEVPVGAVLVLDNHIIAEGYNSPISTHDPTAHAEINALRNAAKHNENYRLSGTTLYVTLEPCLMCVGAMMHARVTKVIYGAHDVRWNARNQCGNHTVQYEGGLLAEESTLLLKDFFSQRRV